MPETIEDADRDTADAGVETILEIRRLSKELLGGNCYFAVDDLLIMAHLAERAISAGLTDGLHWSVLDSLDEVAGRERDLTRDRSAREIRQRR